MNTEDSLKRAEELLGRLEKARADLERVSGSEDSEEAIAVLTELAEIAKQVEAELAKARREAETEARMKKRLDVLLVERGLAESRSQAQALVLAGRVPGFEKPGMQVEESADVAVEQPPRFVSRGGEKLDHALSVLGLDVAGLDCLDVGASTGGFTDALLQRGAARVIARRRRLRAARSAPPRGRTRDGARADERAVPRRASVRARARHVRRLLHQRPHRPPARARLAAPGWQALVLVKPQFEAGKADVPRGGVVRDPEVHRRVLREVVGGRARLGSRNAGGRRLGAAWAEGKPRVLPPSRPLRASRAAGRARPLDRGGGRWLIPSSAQRSSRTDAARPPTRHSRGSKPLRGRCGVELVMPADELEKHEIRPHRSRAGRGRHRRRARRRRDDAARAPAAARHHRPGHRRQLRQRRLPHDHPRGGAGARREARLRRRLRAGRPPDARGAGRGGPARRRQRHRRDELDARTDDRALRGAWAASRSGRCAATASSSRHRPARPPTTSRTAVRCWSGASTRWR